MLPISAEHREGAGMAAGDDVEVDLEVDTYPREVTMPDDMAGVVNGDNTVRAFDGRKQP